MKPHFNICQNIAMGGFKKFLTRALPICSEKYFAQETKFLINVLVENEHSITVLERVIKRIYEQHYSRKIKGKHRSDQEQ